MNFEHPAALLGLSALPLLVLLSASRLRGVVRAVTAGGLILAIAGPAVDRQVRSAGIIVLARDVSLSMRPAERAACPPGEAIEFEDPAIGIALASARAGSGGAVVLATDGRWSPEERTAARREAGRSGVPVLLREMPAPVPDLAPVWLEAVAAARAGDPVEIQGVLAGDPGARGQVLLLIDDEPAGRRTYDGPGRVSWTVTLPAGFHRLALVLEPEVDGDPRNNLALGGVAVAGAPRGVVIEGRPGAGASAAAALRAQGIDLVIERPGEREDWGDFALAVLAEVDPATLGQGAARLRTWVADGGGLLVIAAPSCAASWTVSPLAELLPLELRPEPPPPPDPDPPPGSGDQGGEEERPRVLLLLVLDRSGSMRGDKMAAAREAAIASAETLGEGDTVGVVAFDSAASWVVEPTPATARAGIADAIARLQAGGETDVLAGLRAAAAAARARPRYPVRHIVLLTDGQTPPGDFRGLVTGLAADGITVSTVGLGEDFDGRLLAGIAEWGRGRFYFTSASDEVPRIFTQEARRASGSAPPRQARTDAPPPPLPPRVPDLLPVLPAEPDPATEGLGPWPDLGGACADRTRPAARLLLRVGPRPLLAVSRRGLGQVAAFAAPLDGPAAARWIAWESFPAFAAQLARTLMRRGSAGPSVEVASRGDARLVTVRDPRPAGVTASLDGVPLHFEERGGELFALIPPGEIPRIRRLDVMGDEGRTTQAVAWAWPEELSPGRVTKQDWPRATPEALAALAPAVERRRTHLHAWALAVAVAGMVGLAWFRRRGPLTAV